MVTTRPTLLSTSRILLGLFVTTLCLASTYILLNQQTTMATSPDLASAPDDDLTTQRAHLTIQAAIPPALVPTPSNRRRLIIIGDIHGMDAALAALLRKVRFDQSTDHVVATGDIINKGPDSPAVVDRLLSIRAGGVRGNHEDAVLRAWRRVRKADEVVGEREQGLLATARRLKPHHLKWLDGLPLILTAEPLPLYVVHGGLVAGVPLAKQDPWAVMHMRTLLYPHADLRRSEADSVHESDATTAESDSATEPEEDEALSASRKSPLPVDSHDGEKWTKAWNRYQKRLAHGRRRTVVYGHDSKTGYAEGRYTFGLDSGCVNGGRLTALVVEAAEGKGGFVHRTVSVSCNGL